MPQAKNIKPKIRKSIRNDIICENLSENSFLSNYLKDKPTFVGFMHPYIQAGNRLESFNNYEVLSLDTQSIQEQDNRDVISLLVQSHNLICGHLSSIGASVEANKDAIDGSKDTVVSAIGDGNERLKQDLEHIKRQNQKLESVIKEYHTYLKKYSIRNIGTLASLAGLAITTIFSLICLLSGGLFIPFYASTIPVLFFIVIYFIARALPKE